MKFFIMQFSSTSFCFTSLQCKEQSKMSLEVVTEETPVLWTALQQGNDVRFGEEGKNRQYQCTCDSLFPFCRSNRQAIIVSRLKWSMFQFTFKPVSSGRKPGCTRWKYFVHLPRSLDGNSGIIGSTIEPQPGALAVFKHLDISPDNFFQNNMNTL
jgi:hypothetical protein